MPKQTCSPDSGLEALCPLLPRFSRQEGHQFLHQPNTGKILPGSSSGPIKVSSFVLSWKELSTGNCSLPPTPIQKWLRGLNWDKIAWAVNVILAVSNACAIWSWVNYVFSLCLSFIICKVGIISVSIYARLFWGLNLETVIVCSYYH